MGATTRGFTASQALGRAPCKSQSATTKHDADCAVRRAQRVSATSPLIGPTQTRQTVLPDFTSTRRVVRVRPPHRRSTRQRRLGPTSREPSRAGCWPSRQTCVSAQSPRSDGGATAQAAVVSPRSGGEGAEAALRRLETVLPDFVARPDGLERAVAATVSGDISGEVSSSFVDNPRALDTSARR